MIEINVEWLRELGVSEDVSAYDLNRLLRFAYQTLEMRVGIELADQMTNDQLDEFEGYFQAKDDAGAFQWLEANFPNYKDIVQNQFGLLTDEMRAALPLIEDEIRAEAAA